MHPFPHAHRHHEFLALGTDRIEPLGQELLLLIELRPAGRNAFGDLLISVIPRACEPVRPCDLETNRPALTAA
ncbi:MULTISPECIES: hypothetical protein [Streptomycetaceae]|uniref:hypothetical protein n=1 Tax=unclassified Streptomyces TaxID=2593676 RepID=UPI0033EF387D